MLLMSIKINGVLIKSAKDVVLYVQLPTVPIGL